jgi:hypothetical protein
MSAAQQLIASRKRAAHPDFVPTFGLDALRTGLPLGCAGPQGVLPSGKRRYRSAYRYLADADFACASHLANLTLFEVALRLIDFAPRAPARLSGRGLLSGRRAGASPL